MTSILEPFLSKRSPNETGTCSVYANVNVVKNVENNEGDVFTIKDDTAETTYNIKAPTVEANQVKITSSNTEIDNDDKNAVNKSYCDNNYIKKTDPLRLDQISALSISLRTPYGDVPIGTSYYNYTDSDGVIHGVPAVKINGGNYFYNDRAYFTKPISIYGTRNIEFNTNAIGQIADSGYPQGKLSNLVTSTITTTQLNTLLVQGLGDNVCPTYNYCQNNFIRDGASSVKFGGLEISNADDVFKFSIFSSNGKTYLRMLQNNSQFIYFRDDLIQIPTKLGISNGGGIQFNTNESGGKIASVYPQGVLKNLVPSTITSDELASYTQYNIMDNVCPTYQFTENTYVKKSDYPSSGIIAHKKIGSLTSVADSGYIEIKVVSEALTSFFSTSLDFNTFPTPNTDDMLEISINGQIQIISYTGSLVTTFIGKSAGVAGLISLFLKLKDENNKKIGIPLNWAVISYDNSTMIESAIISINTTTKLPATQVLTDTIPTTGIIQYYSANYTNNNLRFYPNFDIYATLIRTT